MKRLVYVASILSVSLLLSACNAVPDDVQSVIDNQNSMGNISEQPSQIEMLTLSEIIDEIEFLE